MKFLKKLACATAVAMSFAGAASAAQILTDWRFNPNGGGFAAAQNIEEYLDINGNSFIQLTPTGGTSFSFIEHAVFNILQADSNGKVFPMNYPGGNITAMFEGFGTGNLGVGSGTGSFTFDGGQIRMFQNPINGQYGTDAGIFGSDRGNLIATFDVLEGGGGEVDSNGSPIANGTVTVFARAGEGDLAPGYFFRGTGEDLSMESIMSFAFTNANPISDDGVTPTLVSEVACQYAGFTGAGCPSGTGYTNAPGEYFFLSNNGQFKLAEVPEPGSLALFGIALLGAGVASRKRAKKV